jgi:alkylation response protein AidB-like acyl-CoA dehydrogenase
MDLTQTDEDRLLFSVVRDFSAKHMPEVPPREETRPDRSGWRELAELGLLALGTEESRGGPGGTWLQVSLVARALAQSANDQPYLGCGVLVPALLAAADGTTGHVSAITSGDRRIGLGLRADLCGLACAEDESYAIGFDCGGADALLVLASRRPLRLALVPAGSRLGAIDSSIVLTRTDFTSTDVATVGDPIQPEAVASWEAKALVAVSAGLVGTMQGTHSLAAGHAKIRTQFGQPIGAFQAVAHMIADQYVSTDAALSAVQYAAWRVDNFPNTALMAGRTAKAYTAQVARPACETTIQVLGGMGFLWDSWAHVFLRRAILGSAIFGDDQHHTGMIGEARSAAT